MAKRNGFSESTFAFAATREISRLDPWWSTHAPILPSLRSERRGGYDVRFDLPATVLLIQYKLSAEASRLRMVQKPRGSAGILRRLRRECSDGFCQFWTTDHQHRLLDRVARRFPYTYYVAPRFSELADLHTYCAERAILENSILIKLSDFPTARRGSSCRHRVISPHLSSKTFIFSKPKMADRSNLRSDLRDVWKDWLDEIPLAMMVEEIWERLPRIGKTRALNWARQEVALARERPRLRYESPPSMTRDAPRMIAPPDAEIAARPPSIPRRPPWPAHLFRERRGAALVKYDESKQIQLLALARIFALAGLDFSLMQPSEKALENTEYYDDGR